jgi:hypothetical protein
MDVEPFLFPAVLVCSQTPTSWLGTRSRGWYSMSARKRWWSHGLVWHSEITSPRMDTAVSVT